MSILQSSRQVVKGVATVKNASHNPLEFFLDSIIQIIVKAIMPVPFASELVIYFKGPILAMLLGGILFFISLLFIIITMLFTPFSAKSSLANILGVPAGQNMQQVIQALNGYNEEGFSDADMPNKDPFGGNGIENMTITVTYHEVESFDFNGQGITETEQGIDIIPNSQYYARIRHTN